MRIVATPIELTQRTLSEPFSYSSEEEQTGRRVSVIVRPASSDTGICFVMHNARDSSKSIPARIEHVSAQPSGVALVDRRGMTVYSVQHLLAAFAAFGIDNAIVLLDESANPTRNAGVCELADLIRRAGVTRQVAPRRAIRIDKPICVRERDRSAMLMPSATPRMTLTIASADPETVNPVFAIEMGLHEAALQRELSEAQTPPRRKLFDCIGALAIAGAPLFGHLRVHNPDHPLMGQLLEAFIGQADAWAMVDAASVALRPNSVEHLRAGSDFTRKGFTGKY